MALNDIAAPPGAAGFLAGGGEAGAMLRSFDWTASPLGPPEGWPQPLKTLVGVMLAANQPMFLAWGPTRTFLYNDAYAEILAAKHPAALGGDFLEVWHEIRGDLLPIVEEAYAGRPVQMDDIELLMHRRGYPEETHFAFSYTPVRDEAGAVAGFFCPCVEITEQVFAGRRQAFRLALEQRLRDLSGASEVIAVASEALGQYLDVAQVAYAEVEPDGDTAIIEREWNNGEMASNAGRHRLDDFGPAFIADLRRGDTIAIPDVRLDPRTSSPEALAAFAKTSIRAFLNVPVVKAGRLAAVLAVHSQIPRAWTAEEIVLTEEIAERTWAAAERARAEAELRTSETRLQSSLRAAERKAAELGAVLESMPDAVYIGTAEGITHANRPALEQLGFASYEDLNRHVATLAEEIQTRDAETGALIALEEQAFTRAFRGERVIQDVRVRHRITGEDRIVRCAAAPVTMDGQVIAAVAVNTDITEAKLAEAELRSSEARLAFLDRLAAETASLANADAVLATTTRLLGEHLKLSVCAYADMDEDEDGFTIRGDWAAAGSTSIVGHYSLADFGKLAVKNLGAGLPLVVNDNLRELALEEAATFQSIGIAATICMPLVKEGRLTALMAIHDRVPRIWTEAELSLLREVTARSWAHVERVAAIAELRASEARYRTLFETVDAGFCVVEMIFDESGRPVDYRFVEANPAFERQTGLNDAVGRTAGELVPDLEPHWFELYGRVALTGEATRFEEGSTAMGRWFDVHALRVGDPDARRVAILFNDISKRRAAEEGLRELNDTLEQRVAERTAELEQAQEALRQSQKLEAMGQLTGGVAHDFNNLLTPIVGSLDMLVRRELGSERERRLIDGALQSAERAKTLVQRLLAFARRQPLQPSAVDIKALVGGMAELIASTSGPKIDVRVRLPDDLPAAVADANQLEMAVLNLAVNARDAMPEGGVLTLSAAAETVGPGRRSALRPGDYVRLSVEDTGIGMDEATRARAVEPFFSTKGIGKGTGLGLSMAHGLASQLEGGLTLSSRPGEGTRVDLWLPVSLVDAKSEGQTVGARARPAGRGTALLVDDEDLVRMSTADMLMDLGYAVVEAASAEAALQLVEDGLGPDLLVTDHLMPGMTGLELVQTLRAERPGLPVLIISGYAEAEGIASEFARLTKPFRIAELGESLSGLSAAEQGAATSEPCG